MYLKVFLCFLSFFFIKQIEACTAFQLDALDGGFVYCRSMEYNIPLNSNVLVVGKEVPFQGTVDGKSQGITWKGKYGYIGMNQSILPTLVSDGMNEKGLVAGSLYLPGFTRYEKMDGEKKEESLGSWELLSYILGNFATVEEVKEGIKKIRVVEEPVPHFQGFIIPLHYYVCDASGKAIVIEYIDGKRHVHDNPLGVLTNSPSFDWHLLNMANYLHLDPKNVKHKKIKGTDLKNFSHGTGLMGLPGDYTPSSRFIKAAFFSEWATPQKTTEETVLVGFHILNTFDIFKGIIRIDADNNYSLDNKDSLKGVPIDENATQWVVVHDRDKLKTYVRDYKSLKIQEIDLKKLDFSKPLFSEIKIDKLFNPEEITSQITVFNKAATSEKEIR